MGIRLARFFSWAESSSWTKCGKLWHIKLFTTPWSCSDILLGTVNRFMSALMIPVKLRDTRIMMRQGGRWIPIFGIYVSTPTIISYKRKFLTKWSSTWLTNSIPHTSRIERLINRQIGDFIEDMKSFKFFGGHTFNVFHLFSLNFWGLNFHKSALKVLTWYLLCFSQLSSLI